MKTAISRKKRKETRDGWLFLLPFIILVSIFFIYPALDAFYLSFHKYSLLSTQSEFVGIHNYLNAFHDSVFIRALLNTLGLMVIAVPLQLIIALCLAMIVNSRIRGKSFYRTAYFLPYVTSVVAIAIIFMFLFKDGGIVNSIIELLGLHSISFFNNTHWALPLVGIMVIWEFMGFYMIIFLAGLQNIQQSLYEAAEIDGANKWQQLINVTLPQLKPTIFFNLIISMSTTAALYGLVVVISKGKGGPLNSTMTILLYIVNTAFDDFQMGYACAQGIILFIILFSLTIISKFIFKEETD